MQVLADAAGRLVWASPALPGATDDLTAARDHGMIGALSSANVMTFADKGYQGAGGTVWTPFKRQPQRPPLSHRQKDVNRAHVRIRALGERAIATLKTWKILAKLRCCPRRATAIVQAILVLQAVENARYPGENSSLRAPISGGVPTSMRHKSERRREQPRCRTDLGPRAGARR